MIGHRSEELAMGQTKGFPGGKKKDINQASLTRATLNLKRF